MIADITISPITCSNLENKASDADELDAIRKKAVDKSRAVIAL